MASTSLKTKDGGYRAELDDAERASRDEIMALQTKRLAWSLKHAYDNVAHYSKAFDAAGVHPSDFKQLSDLAKFPFTVKTDLRDNYPFNMFAVPRENLVRVHASSGTTGKPIVVGYTKADIDMWSDVMARSIRAAGGRTGMIMHNAYGYGLFTGGLGAHYGAERLGCTVVPVSGGMTERQVQLINDFRPDIITVTPSYMLAILDEFKRQGLDPRKSSLKFGIFGAEPWTNAMRAEIEQAFDMDATDIYGLSEVIGPGVAQECVETKDGLHIWEDHFYPEVIDPETGEVLPDGEKGELVFTSLTKEAFPMIRYRTRDLTRLLPGTARPGMRRMEKVTGRSDDMIILRGVNVFPTQIEEALLATDWCGGHFIIELTRDGRMDEMTVLAEARPERWDGSGLTAHAEKVATFIKNTIGIIGQCPGRRAGHAGALARQGQACLRQAAERVIPDAHHERARLNPGQPVQPRSQCLDDPPMNRGGALRAPAGQGRQRLAALAPVVERHTLTRAPNELLIEVKAAAVNPSDVKAATGLMPYAVFPRTPGRDYAGVVIDGPAAWIGREVFGSSGDLGIRRDGTHATHLVVEREAVVEKPRSLSWEEAAGIGVPFVTAMEGLRRAGHAEAGRDCAGDGRQRQGRAGRGADRDLARRARHRRGAQG